ncbi:MAG: TRAP transporter substrate-binding protein DctP [Clostridiales bacterium]|nr:TRAP transporter substrate-binding protein DctP [Clostridiales bacterium]
MKKLRRLAFILLSLVMIISLAACAGSSSTTNGSVETPNSSGTTPDSANSSSGSNDEVYELVFNTFIAEVIQPGRATRATLEYIEEDSGGRIKFKDYWDGTYISFAETIQAVVTGTIDIGFIDPGHINESFYANQIINMPIEADVPSRLGQTQALVQAINEIPELQQELEKIGVMWLGVASAGSGIIHFADDVDVRSPDDLKGMSMEALAAGNELLKECGASAIGSPVTEWYTSLERNVIDALIHNWGAVDGFKFYEVTKTHLFFTTEEESDEDSRGLYVSTMGFIMNKDKFESLPQDLQEILLYGFGEVFPVKLIEFEMPACLSGYTAAKERGNKFIYLEPEEVEEWREKVASSNKVMLDKIVANGYDAYALYDKWNAMLQAKHDEEKGS